MPRTSLTVQEPTRTAIVTPTSNAVDQPNGNRFVNDGKIVMRVVNGSGGDLTVTIATPEVYDTDIAIPSRTYVIPNAGIRYIGPFPSKYNATVDDVQNSVAVDWSSGTSVVCELIRVSQAT